jgi:hypothetical protein
MRMLRRKAARMRAGSISRKKAQPQIGAIISALFTKLHAIDEQDPVMPAAKARILADLGGRGDLAAEADIRVFATLDVEAKTPADRDGLWARSFRSCRTPRLR